MRERTTLARLSAVGAICFTITIAGCAASVDHPSPTNDIRAVTPAKAAGTDSNQAQIAKPALHKGDVWIDRI
jgi:hypothetical protein